MGGTPSRETVTGSARPTRREPAAPGVGLVELAGERLEGGLGSARVGVVVGGAHLLRDRRAERVGELVFEENTS